MMANSIKQSTQQRRKEGTNKKDPSLGQKSKTKVGHKGAKEQIMFQSPHQSQEVYRKERGMRNLKQKLEKVISLEELSLAIMTCFKIEVT
jgi:hypothetical protein